MPLMRFLDRAVELERLARLARAPDGGLGVVYGRRRLGKTRLLLEAVRAHDGLYSVADQSAGEVQRAHFARAVAERLEGFSDVTYPDWRTLLERLAREAGAAGWRGPIVFDELPYLVSAARELASVLQQWVDHGAREARLSVCVAGSSQRMMQGLVLDRSAPLFGRAREIIEVQPLACRWLREALGLKDPHRQAEAWCAWGGVPRYWELAADSSGDLMDGIDALVLTPSGPLHREPDRLLLEELPPAADLRPVLDAIGAGAHRVSEIGGRIGRPATSLARPLERLMDMDLVRREVPFGEPPRKSKRSLYRIADPFLRLWFRVVAPQRSTLTVATRAGRLAILRRSWGQLAGEAWEELARAALPALGGPPQLARLGPWGAASRWWHGGAAEWDVVAENVAGGRLLLGEARWSAGQVDARELGALAREVARRPAPALPARYSRHQLVRALFVPAVTRRPSGAVEGVHVVTAREVVAAAP